MINAKQCSPNFKEKEIVLGSCFVQSLELYKQILAKDFNPKGFFVNLRDFSFLDEEFLAQNEDLLKEYKEKGKNLKFFADRKKYLLENCTNIALCDTYLFEKLYKMKFDFEIFENIARLRAFLSKEKFLKPPFFCTIYGKKEHHLNLLYKDEKALLSINTAQGRNGLPFGYITEQTSDKEAFELIAQNYLSDKEDEVLAFILYYPYTLEEDLSEAYKIIHSKL